MSKDLIYERFQEVVKAYQDSIAIEYEGMHISYQDLNRKANQLANYLKEKGIKPGGIVGIGIDRSIEMIISILAVLKIGGAYLPIDLAYPDERIKFVIYDSKIKLIITNNMHIHRFDKLANEKSNAIDLIVIDQTSFKQTLSNKSKENLNLNIPADNLAYIIYTSGTTGEPKGVIQVHSNVVSLFTTTQEIYEFTNEDIWTLFHSYVFDFSVWEIWGALLYGGKLIIPCLEQLKDAELFYKLCKEKKVTILNQTPSAFYNFIYIAIKKQSKLTTLRFVIFGGEALNIKQLKAWFDFYGYTNPKLVNMYGITEITVHATYKQIKIEDCNMSSNIGTFLKDLKWYILNDNLNPLPIGEVGELYIGGNKLAKEYLNRPQLTSERFIKNPFQTTYEKERGINIRLYKTGDLVKLLNNGELEYVGRNDFQIKIRGYRIELEEIENALNQFERIRQSIVILIRKNKDNFLFSQNKYLVGFYVSHIKLDDLEIMKFLRLKLPEYMLPTFLIHLQTLPLNINGKLDRKLLYEWGSDIKSYKNIFS